MTQHILPLDRLQGLLRSGRGLTSAEAQERRQRHGRNEFEDVGGSRIWDLVRSTATDPMIWFLAGTALLYMLVGQRTEALVLFTALAPLVAMDAFLHHRTRASTEGLKSRVASKATVLRDGAQVEIPAGDVVPGDLAIVSTAGFFPADGIVVAGAGLQVDESSLTGEAYPVGKRPFPAEPTGGAVPIVESVHWGFAGTRLLTGRAEMRIAYTGGETIYGEIVRSVVEGVRERTPLQRAIERLVRVLIAAAVVVCLVLAAVRLWQGYGWVDALVSAVTLASAALPEEFPVVFTFFLSVGVYRLARRQALVRRAVSVENIGRVSCICSDKTGTITAGRLRLTRAIPAPDSLPSRLLELAAIASRSESGDPLDRAILNEAESVVVPAESPERLATFPFTEDRKRETAIVRGVGSQVLAITKGAPEVVLAMSLLDGTQRGEWDRRLADLAEAGQKVVACAWRPGDETSSAQQEPIDGYRLAGLLAFEDPVKEGVAEAVEACRDGGIHTIMVTGDHATTARAVARRIGLGAGAPIVISGDELERRATHHQGEALAKIDVIARAAPYQKVVLVRALQEAGEVVAVTGDGVNDAPALQAADIGIAMGERGTRTARDVAAIVLLDDNFRTIVRAIGEGRQLFRNLQLSFVYLLVIHLPLVITAAIVPLAGFPLLYLPIHIVWLELIIHPTALLVFQGLPARDRLAPAQIGGATGFFSARQWVVVVAAGLLATVLVVLGYVRSLGSGGNIAHGRAMTLAALTCVSAALAAALSRLRTRTSRIVAGGSIALSVALIQLPGLAPLLPLEPLHLGDWGLALAGAASVGLVSALFEQESKSHRA